MAAKNPNVKKTNQKRLPGTESKKDAAIHSKSLELKAFEKQRLEVQAKENTARRELLELLEAYFQKTKVNIYQCEGLTAKIKIDKKKAVVILDDDKNE